MLFGGVFFLAKMLRIKQHYFKENARISTTQVTRGQLACELERAAWQTAPQGFLFIYLFFTQPLHWNLLAPVGERELSTCQTRKGTSI